MIHNSIHKPVLLNKVLEILGPCPDKFIIDGTVDGGGHTASILEKMMPRGKLLAIDLDREILEKTKKEIEDKFQIPNSRFQIFWAQDNYANLPEILKKKKLPKANGLLLDLGFSSLQLASGRGFTFQANEPLDMRYAVELRGQIRGTTGTTNDVELREKSPRKSALSQRESASLTAAEVVNSFSEKELADIFWRYGEERFSRKIAGKIVETRKRKRIITTFDLVEVIKSAVPKSYERGRIHPATRIFQALRIYVNKELDNLETVLKNLHNILKPGGAAVMISFHSLEDRIVKNYFREMARNGIVEIITKKPVTAEKEEISFNPRSRSAKLRAVIIKVPKSFR